MFHETFLLLKKNHLKKCEAILSTQAIGKQWASFGQRAIHILLNASLCVVRIRMEAPNSHLFCLALRNCGLALSMEYSADNRQQSPEIFWANSSSEWAGSVGGLRSGCGQLWGRRNQQREASLTWRLQASQLFSTGYSGIQIATSPAICIHSTNNLHQRYLRARSQVFPNRPPPNWHKPMCNCVPHFYTC